MTRGVSRYVWAVTLSLGFLGLMSCERKKKYDLQNVNNVSLNVLSFGINSADDTSLKGVFFSIENKEGSGIIMNMQPLAYGKKLQNVTFPITLSGSGDVTIAIGSGEPKAWTATTKWTVPEDTRELTLKVTGKEANKSYSYDYKVRIRQYTEDPETIAWQEVASPFMSLYPSYLTATGLPHGVTIKRHVAHGTYIYGLGTNGILYTINGGAWTALTGGTGIYDLLGTIPKSSSLSDAPDLMLLVTPNRETTLDATLDPGKQALFATYTASSGVTVSEQYAPVDFPGVLSSGYFSSFSEYNVNYVGASLKLVAVSPGELSGQSLRQTWYYTPGSKKWAKQSVVKLDEVLPRGVSVLKVGELYYRLESSTDKFTVYYSSDAINWTKSGGKATQNLGSELNNSSLITWSVGSDIYVLATPQGSSVPRLLKGTILKTKTNY